MNPDQDKDDKEKNLQKIKDEPMRKLDIQLRMQAEKMLGKNKSIKAKKDAYLTCLRAWINQEPPPSNEEKIAHANYLASSLERYDPHLLTQERHGEKNGLTLFSNKTTRMATAQGLLAQGLSPEEKLKLYFNIELLERRRAKMAYEAAVKVRR